MQLPKVLVLTASVSVLASLSGCGIIPLPSVAIPDVNLTLVPSVGYENQVTYDGSDALGGSSIPSILSNMSISGKAMYSGAGNLQQVAVYMRSVLPTCTPIPITKAQACEASGESAHKVGSISFKNGEAVDFRISGSALDQAAKTGHGYFGFQALNGQSLMGDKLKLSGMNASAKF